MHPLKWLAQDTKRLLVIRVGRFADHVQIGVQERSFIFKQDSLRAAAVALIKHVKAGADTLLKADQMLSHLFLELVYRVNQILLLLLLLVLVIVDALLQSQFWLLKPRQRFRVLLHVAIETRQLRSQQSYEHLLLQVEVGLATGHVIEDGLEVFQIQRHCPK